MPLAMYRVETLRLAPGIAPGRDVLIDRPIGPTPGPIGALHASSGYPVNTGDYQRTCLRAGSVPTAKSAALA